MEELETSKSVGTARFLWRQMYERQKQIPFRGWPPESKGKCKGKCNSRSLRDDNKKESLPEEIKKISGERK
jgi:hypothetical protein